jgi:murein L,D-transpeptidase YcbB/YkuD
MTPNTRHGLDIRVPRRRRGAILAAAVALGAASLLAVACGHADDDDTAVVGSALRSFHPFAHTVELELAPYLPSLSAPPLGLGDAPDRKLADQVRAFYQHRQGQPAWFADGRPRPEAQKLVELLAGLDSEGLEPADYRPDELARTLRAASDGEAGVRPEDVEVGLSWAALLAASDLRYGRVSPQAVASRWLVARERIDLPAFLEKALADGDLAASFATLDPQHPQFAGLLEAFRRYREIAAKGGWPTVPKGPVLKEGELGDAARLRALAQRLQAESFLAAVPADLAAAPAGAKARYGKELADGVRAFQATRTVEVDGSLGPATQEELNVPVAKRVHQLALNLERWRWVPDDFGARAVVVNLPGYTLDVEESKRSVMSMRVVVGEEGWETPVFSDRIRYLVLNPYWNVPTNLFQKEVLPALQRDPGYLAEHGMEVVDGERDDSPVVSPARAYEVGSGSGLRLRARPGADNPLGKVKFMFPNKYDIYLHDTPADALFAKADRSESHGCIRLERPVELAEYLMRDDPKWGGGLLEAAIEGGETKSVSLPQPVPVYLLYFTAAPREDGTVAFYEDIYDLDRAHGQAWVAAASTRPGGAIPAGEKEAMQQQPGAEPTDVGPPRDADGGDDRRGG